MLVALLVEGIHIFVPPPEYKEALWRWLDTISEMRGFDFANLIQQMTLILIVVPLISWRLWVKSDNQRTDRFLVLLTVLLTIITTFQSRWIYYASLAELFLVVRYCQTMPSRWSRGVVVVIFLLGLCEADSEIQIRSKAQAPANQPSPQLALLAHEIDKPGGIMAPWWLSPGLLYFSGQPIVTGSSHCGISGIVAGAKFYTATSWIDAERILQERKVRWVVVYDDQTVYDGQQYVYQLLNTAVVGILGIPFYAQDDKNKADLTVSQILITDHFVPTSLRLRAVTSQFKLYEYLLSSGQ